MFTVPERERIRGALIDTARESDDVVGAALVGSAALDREDAWSDIDLALQLAPGISEARVVEQWSRWIDEQFGVADSFDVFAAEKVRYRVFLLHSSLQIDVSFWPNDRFRATEDGFRLVFGTPATATSPPPPDLDSIVGLSWLYALHARSALARGRLWQATMMLDDLCNQIIALACVRHGLNPWHGCDADRLPGADRAALLRSRATELKTTALGESQERLIRLLLEELERHDAQRAASLRIALRTIAESSRHETA